MKVDPKKERRARWFWLSFILMFFVGQAVLWTFALNVVSNDPSHAIVDDYDSFATQWDQTKAEQAASDALGWHAQMSADHERLVVKLTDTLGKPVEAQVTAKVFHKARAAEVLDVAFSATEPGVLVGEVDMERSGHWRVRLTATRGPDVYTHIEDVTVGQVARR
jgi:nitrogen fixation protein FixH